MDFTQLRGRAAALLAALTLVVVLGGCTAVPTGASGSAPSVGSGRSEGPGTGSPGTRSPATGTPATAAQAGGPGPGSTGAPGSAVVNGFDAAAAYRDCTAAGDAVYPGDKSVEPFDVRFVVVSSTNPVPPMADGTASPTDGSGVDVIVGWRFTDSTASTSNIFQCRVSGDPAAPTVNFWGAKDL